jgi:hypothetical protein
MSALPRQRTSAQAIVFTGGRKRRGARSASPLSEQALDCFAHRDGVARSLQHRYITAPPPYAARSKCH